MITLPMRTRFHFVSLLVCFTCISLVQAQWTPLVSGTQRHLRDVHFHDPQMGWVVGDSGLVMKTTDGGGTWSSQNVGSNHLVSVAFLDADTGYVMPQFSAPYVTYDGGASWAVDSTFYGACYSKRIRFNDRILYLTYDGCFGGAWLYTLDPATKDTTELFEYFPNPLAFGYNDIGFPQPGQAIAMGIDNMTARTSDGGDTWTTVGPNDSLLDWKAVEFISPTEGYAITGDLFMPLYKTLDGGQTWGIDSSWMATFFYPEPTDLDYLAPGYGYVTCKVGWDTTGLIFELEPGQWLNYFQTPYVARAIHMADDSVGYVVGDHGMIWKRSGGPLAASPTHDHTGFQVYPNPASTHVSIMWAGHAAGWLDVFHMDGRRVHQQAILPGHTALDLAHLPHGVYLLRLEADGVNAVKRLVLAR